MKNPTRGLLLAGFIGLLAWAVVLLRRDSYARHAPERGSAASAPATKRTPVTKDTRPTTEELPADLTIRELVERLRKAAHTQRNDQIKDLQERIRKHLPGKTEEFVTILGWDRDFLLCRPLVALVSLPPEQDELVPRLFGGLHRFGVHATKPKIFEGLLHVRVTQHFSLMAQPLHAMAESGSVLTTLLTEPAREECRVLGATAFGYSASEVAVDALLKSFATEEAPSVLRAIVAALARLASPRAVGPVLAAYKKWIDRGERWEVLAQMPYVILRCLPPEKALPVLLDMADEGKYATHAPCYWVGMAIGAHMEFGPFLPLIEQELLAGHGRARKMALVAALGYAEDPRSVESLNHVILNEADDEVRTVAITNLGRVADAEMVMPLIRRGLAEVATDEPTSLRLTNYINALQNLWARIPERSPEFSGYLTRIAESGNQVESVRLHATKVLGWYGDADNLRQLREMRAAEKSERMRRALDLAIGTINNRLTRKD